MLYLLSIVSWILSMAISGAEYMRGMHVLVTVNGLFWIVQCVLNIIVTILDGITLLTLMVDLLRALRFPTELAARSSS